MFKKVFLIVFASFIYVQLAVANFDVKARTAILQDFYSGEILFEKDADRQIFPASMTKIMTSIIAFDLIKNETKINNPIIKKLSHTKYRVLIGPFNDIKKLEESFNEIKSLNFENLEILKNV